MHVYSICFITAAVIRTLSNLITAVLKSYTKVHVCLRIQIHEVSGKKSRKSPVSVFLYGHEFRFYIKTMSQFCLCDKINAMS